MVTGPSTATGRAGSSLFGSVGIATLTRLYVVRVRRGQAALVGGPRQWTIALTPNTGGVG